MAISLYDAIIPGYLQVLGGLRGVLQKGLEHAKSAAVSPQSLADARLIDGMFSLQLQVQRVADHSAGALRDVKAGGFTMPRHDSLDFSGVQKLVADAEAALKAWTRDEVDALQGREMILDTGSSRTSFTAEAFLLSFSQPNFYFHAITAYDILRLKGVPVGKRDYLGQMRTKLG